MVENLNNIYEWHVKDADMVKMINTIDRLEKENKYLQKQLTKYKALFDVFFEIDEMKGDKDVK